MIKTQKINESDFDFNKQKMTSPSYLVERLVAVGFIGIFGLIFFNSNSSNISDLKPKFNQSIIAEVKEKYPDYVVTAEDHQLFKDIFNYTTSTPVSTNSDVKFFNDSVRKDDMKNADFVNQNKNDTIVVTSKILAVDAADKNQIMKESGFANLDYVDIVVEKTYKKGEEVYFEQQIVNVKMENHKIITMNTHRMID